MDATDETTDVVEEAQMSNMTAFQPSDESLLSSQGDNNGGMLAEQDQVQIGTGAHHAPAKNYYFNRTTWDKNKEVIFGDIQNNYNYYYQQNLLNGTFGDESIKWSMVESRAHYQAGRLALPDNDQDDCYSPYVTVKNATARTRLSHIALRFQFLDRGFAAYFHSVKPESEHGMLNRLLASARDVITKRQRRDSGVLSDTSAVYLGDLGNFCEQVSQQDAQRHGSPPLRFMITNASTDARLRYLQDAFEVPYWKLILDAFLIHRANSKIFDGDVVLTVLNSARMTVLEHRHQLEKDLKRTDAKELQHITPIMRGIDARLAVLENALSSEESSFEQQDMLERLFETPQEDSAAAVESTPSLQNSPSETLAFIGLIIFSLVASMVPGYKAFHISMQTKAPGKTGDADFWYLIQSSIIAILGNLTVIVPLFRESWLSPTYTLMWAFLGVGILCVIISVAIYPFCNPGWSSMLSFFGSVFSTSSVLVMTQASTKPKRETNQPEVSSEKKNQ